MGDSDYIHGGTDAREVARLEKQSHFTALHSLPRFDAAPGMRVLDLATGVGAMAGQLLRRYPGIQLVGVDLHERQLAEARRLHPGATYVQADAAHLPFPDASFERVHCSWLLEHVREPAAVLREVRRVLAPGGLCHFIEVDNASLRTHPRCPETHAMLEVQNAAQRASGGDPFIGPKLERLFREAGFTRTDIAPAPVHGDAADPAYFRMFVEEFAEIFESLDEALGPALAPRLHAAAAELRALPGLPGASMDYVPWIARGYRD
jgi:ubiquinone/menaquinone biosynthesis C-methylase UbiE